MAVDFNIFGSLGMGAGWGTMFLYSFYIAVLGGVAWVAYYTFRYNIKVSIHDQQGYKEYDKARIKRDANSVKEFELKRFKNDFTGDMKPEFLVPVKKRFGIATEVHLFRDEKGDLRPIRPPQKRDYHVWRASDQADKKWAAIKMKEAVARYTQQSFWEQYGQLLVQTAMIATVAVLIVVIVRENTALIEAIQGGMGSVSENLRLAAEASNTQVVEAAT